VVGGDLARHSSSAIDSAAGRIAQHDSEGNGIMKVMGKRSLSSFVAALINIGWYGAIVLLALSICLLAVAPWVDPPRVEVGLAVPAAFRIEPETHHVSASPFGFENVHIEKARGSLRFSPRSSAVVAGTAVVFIAVLALIMWVLGQLRAVFGTLRSGQPFVAANATRIRRIAYAVIVGELSRALVAYVGMHYAMTHFSLQGVRFEARPDVDIIAIMCGLIVLVVAEVFREGTRLDEEQSLTV
jgi:hypothetical protein